MTTLIEESLALCADSGTDITDLVYQRFFDTHKKAYGLMDHTDIYMKGRMLQEALELLIAENKNYLEWEVENHLTAYQVDISMYRFFFDAIRNCVAAELDDQWSTQYAEAWADGIESLTVKIEHLSKQSSLSV